MKSLDLALAIGWTAMAIYTITQGPNITVCLAATICLAIDNWVDFFGRK